MKKTFKLIDLDCANCAAKMENAIKKIDGVADASVSFMAQKMTVEADDARFDEIGSVLKIKEIRREKEELLKSLEMYYRVFFLDEEIEGMEDVEL